MRIRAHAHTGLAAVYVLGGYVAGWRIGARVRLPSGLEVSSPGGVVRLLSSTGGTLVRFLPASQEAVVVLTPSGQSLQHDSDYTHTYTHTRTYTNTQTHTRAR